MYDAYRVPRAQAARDTSLAGRPPPRALLAVARATTWAGGSTTATRPKAQRNERLDAHYRADPVPLSSVLTPAGLDPDDEWTRVTVTGTYDGGPVFVRSRTARRRARARGALGAAPDAGEPGRRRRPRLRRRRPTRGPSVLPTVDAAPDRTVTVTGWVRRGEASRGNAAVRRARWRASTCRTRPSSSASRPSCRATCCWSRRRCLTAPLRRAPGARRARPQPRAAPGLRLPVVAHHGASASC